MFWFWYNCLNTVYYELKKTSQDFITTKQKLNKNTRIKRLYLTNFCIKPVLPSFHGYDKV